VVCQDLSDKAQRFQMPRSPFSWRQIVIRDPEKGTSGGGGSATKRKAESDNATPSKNAKPNAPPVGGRSSAEDEDEDDADEDG
jgi:hypothetical protein